ncbi:MAG: fatty acid CoA ligase family protein [Puniceicoccaceae bacterium]
MNGGAEADFNVSRHLPLRAADSGDRAAVRVPAAAGGEVAFADTSFAELERRAALVAGRMAAAGIRRGTRVLVLARPGLELIAGVFAILRTGAVPVVIDPGMGLRGFLRSVRRTGPQAVFGIPRGLWISRVFRGAFRGVRTRIPVRAVSGAASGGAGPAFPVVPAAADDPAAILFTSGSTGPAKGVLYRHGMFAAQIDAVRDRFGIEPGEIDFPMLPVFALFNPALGMTTVVPPMDPSKPARADPAKLLKVMRAAGVTNSFGSPVLWERLVGEGERTSVSVGSLRRILAAGCALPPALAARMGGVFPAAAVFSPYGATEALPLSVIDGGGIAGSAGRAERGGGICVGRPLPGVGIRIVAVADGVLDAGRVEPLAAGEVGEIIASGPMVTREYDRMEEATRRSKVEWEGRLWHRMGDLGYRDGEGCLWFCGRVVERVVTAEGSVFYPECCEQVFNRHPEVYRTALVGLGPEGNRVPAIVVQPRKGAFPRVPDAIDRWVRELREIGSRTAGTAPIRHFFFKRDFPVDVRHNAKIHRLALAREFATHGFHPTQVAEGGRIRQL